jgi:putative ubiquitin-RnfH superfamily antitoxin RatB of RatAB toxin-antitoxin module
MIRVEVIRAWPRRFDSIVLELAEGATLQDALATSGLSLEGITGFAVFGEREALEYHLRDGDRVELLRPLRVDPKEARRRRASSAGTQK